MARDFIAASAGIVGTLDAHLPPSGAYTGVVPFQPRARRSHTWLVVICVQASIMVCVVDQLLLYRSHHTHNMIVNLELRIAEAAIHLIMRK